jgi:hypothetical protein
MDSGGNWRGLPPQVHLDAPGTELRPHPIELQPPPVIPPYNPSAAPTSLPAPPPVPHHGLYLDQFQLANTLRALRARAQTRADNALLAMRLSGVLMLWGSLGLGYMAFVMTIMNGMASLTSPDPETLIGLLVMLPFGGAYLAYGIAVLLTVGKVFPYHYQLAWQRLLYESDSILLADEERLRILQDNLPGKFWGSAVVKHHFNSLGERLEFAAFHLPSLRRLAHRPEDPPRRDMRQTEVARQYAKHFDQQGVVIGCCVAAGIISYAQLIYLIVALRQGPAICQAAARLAAFVDFYLEEPRINVAHLPPPVEPQGWWARSTAPWHYRGD